VVRTCISLWLVDERTDRSIDGMSRPEVYPTIGPGDQSLVERQIGWEPLLHQVVRADVRLRGVHRAVAAS